MVALGASLSAVWIMVANAWMQTPAGVVEKDGVLIVQSYAAVIFNPAMPTSVAHMWLACLKTSLLVVGGISAWYLLRGRHAAFFLKSLVQIEHETWMAIPRVSPAHPARRSRRSAEPIRLPDAPGSLPRSPAADGPWNRA
jgi:cytochrome bd-type quinol oxidase subunit 1